jgi:type VI secretion system secreted protein VgrG
MSKPLTVDELFQLSCDALGADAVFVGFKGREAISRTFAYDVFVSVPLDAVPEADALIRKPLTFTVAGGLEAGPAMPTHGLIAAFEVIDETAERALVRLDVRPTLWFLGLSQHSRVFTEMKVGDILEEVLKAAGLTDYELQLSESYPTRAHVSQYKESDLAFLERLMEYDGIHYFFKHTADAHKLVISDSNAAHAASRPAPIAYHPVEGGDLGSDLFVAIVERQRLEPKLVRLTDYDYVKPALAIKGEESVAEGTSSEVVEHDAGALDPGDASRLAKVRKEELLARQRVFEMDGSAFHLRSGATYQVSGHPRDAVNDTYLCTDLMQLGNARVRTADLARLTHIPEALVYEARTHAIRADVRFRPERLRKPPRVPAFERAKIDGPASSDYAQLDDQGRYRIKLGYDETDRAGEKPSVRTRMMQPHAGNPEGWHLPLRKDTEVLVAFIGGDPDRPVIAGAVPNAETPSVVTSSNHTRNIFHSGGDNHIEIEDQDGSQWIDVRSPTKNSRFHAGKPHDDDSHYVVLNTDGDCRFTIGGNQDIRVGAKLTEEVKGNVIETYNTSQTSKVTGPQETTVLGAVEENYQNGHKTTVTGKVTEIYCAGQQTDVSGVRSETYAANQKTLVVGGATHTHDKQDMSVLGANSTQIYAGPKTVMVSGACTYNFDSTVTQLFGPTTYICPTLNWTAQTTGTIFTPTWNKVFVSLTDIQATRTETASLHVKCYALAITGVLVLKFEAVAISIGANGLKRTANGFSGGTYGMKLTLNALAVETEPLKLSAAPLLGEM